MKHIFLAAVIAAFGLAASAQTTAVKPKSTTTTKVKSKTSNKKPVSKKRTLRNPVMLVDTAQQQAFGAGYPYRSKLSITRAMQSNSAGNDNTYQLPANRLPKQTYGLANGKIFLGNTTATSSGTVYGNGGVGTGTAISGMGTASSTPGVNGKAPEAGVGLWGNRIAVKIDSTINHQ